MIDLFHQLKIFISDSVQKLNVLPEMSYNYVWSQTASQLIYYSGEKNGTQ